MAWPAPSSTFVVPWPKSRINPREPQTQGVALKVLVAVNRDAETVVSPASLLDELNDVGFCPELYQFGDKVDVASYSRILAFGGDGFMMTLIRGLGYPSTPIYGVNHGRVGFLMNPQRSVAELAEHLRRDDLPLTSFPVLEAGIVLNSGLKQTERAFNDVVLERASGQTVQLELFIDGVLLNRYSGDGLIVATPGGSTAYSLAAGGPVVHHSVSSMTVTPLCPHRPVQFHSLQFPLLLALDSTIRIVNGDLEKRPVRCVCDGRSVEDAREVTIRFSGLRVNLLREPGYNFVETLVSKIIGFGNDDSSA